MKVRKLVLFAVTAMILSVLSALFAGPAAAGTQAGRVYPPGTSPLGASYGTWAGRWGVFAFGTSVGENPLVHPTDCDDSVKLIDGVVFLTVSGGGAITVSCPIPSGTPILVTPGGNDGILSLNGDTPKAVRHYVNDSLARFSGVGLSIDGTRVDIDDFRTHTDGLFTIQLPKYNIVGMPRGPARMFIGGWFAMLKGFDDGTHTIHAQDVLDDGTPASVIYHLTVK